MVAGETHSGEGSFLVADCPFDLVLAHTPADLSAARTLLSEYAAEIQVDLDFQGFVQELAALPGLYAPPRGRLILARCGADPAGCVGLRPFAENTGPQRGITQICEMKRLYVRTAFRGRGLGRALAQAVIAAARESGYVHMRLDTLAHMTVAIALYRDLGFRDIPPYRPNPLPGATYLELDLVPPS
jgi:putative acetyltransferase